MIIFGENGFDVVIEHHLKGTFLQKNLKIAKNIVIAFFLGGGGQNWTFLYL